MKVTVCVICSKKGHLINECPQRNMEVDASTLCLKCGNKGHEMFTCNSNYSPEDLKHIQCCVCKDFGHLCCVDYKMDIPLEASCYKCGLSGHFGWDCGLSEVPITVENEFAEAPDAPEQEILCNKCRKTGISKHGCRHCKKARRTVAKKKKIAAESVAVAPVSAKVKKSRKPPRRVKNFMPLPAVTTYPVPYNVIWQPPPNFGPYYGKPGSNVWLSPAAAAAARPAPKLQNQPQFPPQIWNHPQATQTPQQPLNQQTAIRVPQTLTQVPSGPFTCFTQFPHSVQIPVPSGPFTFFTQFPHSVNIEKKTESGGEMAVPLPCRNSENETKNQNSPCSPIISSPELGSGSCSLHCHSERTVTEVERLAVEFSGRL